MGTSLKKRGFVTIATGKHKYYQMAVDLLKSYKVNGNSSLPFALICDKDCPEARMFDDVVLISDPHHSYLDKLSLYKNLPYEETIFIDADALILAPTAPLWDDFAQMGDFSCYGRELPLDSKDGWFYYEEMGDLKEQIRFCVSMHGGLYYMRKTEICKNIFENAENFVNNYHKYRFAEFSKPADEPVLALSMALAGCKPCNRESKILFLPSFDGKLRADRRGNLKIGKKNSAAIILHVGNRHIPRFLYQYLRANILHNYEGKSGIISNKERRKLRWRYLRTDAKFFVRYILLRIMPEKMITAFRTARKRKKNS